jgi:hypothetical protein
MTLRARSARESTSSRCSIALPRCGVAQTPQMPSEHLVVTTMPAPARASVAERSGAAAGAGELEREGVVHPVGRLGDGEELAREGVLRPVAAGGGGEDGVHVAIAAAGVEAGAGTVGRDQGGEVGAGAFGRDVEIRPAGPGRGGDYGREAASLARADAVVQHEVAPEAMEAVRHGDQRREADAAGHQDREGGCLVSGKWLRGRETKTRRPSRKARCISAEPPRPLASRWTPRR